MSRGSEQSTFSEVKLDEDEGRPDLVLPGEGVRQFEVLHCPDVWLVSAVGVLSLQPE